MFATNSIPQAAYNAASQPPTATPGLSGNTKPQSGGGNSGSGGGSSRYNNSHRNNASNSSGTSGGGGHRKQSRNANLQLQQGPQPQLAGSNIIVSSVAVGGTGGLVSVMPTIVDPHQQQPMSQQHQMQQQPQQPTSSQQQQSGSQQNNSSRHYSSMKSNTGKSA